MYFYLYEFTAKTRGNMQGRESKSSCGGKWGEKYLDRLGRGARITPGLAPSNNTT